MELLAISLGMPKPIAHNGETVLTGIYKAPVEGPVRAGRLGLEGDVQIDRENHGGPDKAIYVYTHENYRFWEQNRGSDALPFGQFGENLTVTGLPDDTVHIGDTFRIGGTLLQVTQPRVPCYKLGVRMGDPHFVKTFLHSGRVGFYLRVLEEGILEAGNVITPVARDPAELSIRDAILAILKGPRQREIIEKALNIPALSDAWRQDLSDRRQSV